MFHGSMVALVTPMRDDGTLDEASLDRLIEFHIECGTDAIIAVGTTGVAEVRNVDVRALRDVRAREAHAAAALRTRG